MFVTNVFAIAILINPLAGGGGSEGQEIVLSPASRIWHLGGQVQSDSGIIADKWELRIHAACCLRPLAACLANLRTWGEQLSSVIEGFCWSSGLQGEELLFLHLCA